MHAARVKASTRLQRTLALLADQCWHDTREINIQANVLAVNSAIAELRANGYMIGCRKRDSIFEYRLVHARPYPVGGRLKEQPRLAPEDAPAAPPPPLTAFQQAQEQMQEELFQFRTDELGNQRVRPVLSRTCS